MSIKTQLSCQLGAWWPASNPPEGHLGIQSGSSIRTITRTATADHFFLSFFFTPLHTQPTKREREREREKRNERLEGIKADSIVRSIVDDGAQLVDLSRQLLVFLGAFCAGITGFSPSVLLLRFFFVGLSLLDWSGRLLLRRPMRIS